MILFVSACEDKNPTQSFQEDKALALNDTFTLRSLSGEYYTLSVSHQKVTVQESHKGITLFYFFSTGCTQCLHEIPYLNDLQDAYKKDLFIAGILVHDTIKKKPFKHFVQKHNIDYYLSYSKDNNTFLSLLTQTLKLPASLSLPLTVMYVEGAYFTHYEGSVPIEMIRYDIEQAQESLK
jgi:thiol-disulfide isomerase/thioredoxin